MASIRLPIALAAMPLLVALAACGEGPPPRHVPGGDAAAGRAAIRDYGCGACHVVPGVPGATGRVAPPLTAFADRSFVAGVAGNSAENVIAWIMNPQSLNPGTAMPDLGVTEAQARNIAAYLFTLR